MDVTISLPHTIASLFGKSKPEELTTDEQQILETVQTIAANRVKLVSYPNVEDCPENYRVFCIKINPGMQLPKETRLFLLIHMQSSMAVAVSFDGVKSREHKWVHHNKKIEEGISRLEKCGLSLKDEALTRIAETVVTVAASPLDNAATGSQVAIEAALAWLAGISADQTVFPKKQIVQAFQLLIDIFNPSSTLNHDAARQVGAFIVKSLENKLRTIAMSPRQNSCQIEILSPNHEFYRMLALGNKQADKFMKALMGLFKPQLTSTQAERQYHQFLAYSLSMSPRAILAKLLEYPHDDLFTDAVIVNNVLGDVIMATHQGKLTGAEVLAFIQLLHDKDRLSFIEYSLIAPLLKLFQQAVNGAARSSHTGLSAANAYAADTSTRSTSSTSVSSSSSDEIPLESLYRNFCMIVCPKFSREEFKLYCHEANPFRNIDDLKKVLLLCKDTPLSAKLQPLLPLCNQLLASSRDRDQGDGRFIMGDLLNGFEQLSATEQITILHQCAPYPLLATFLPSPQEEPPASTPVAVAIKPKSKNKTRTAAPARAIALPSLKLTGYNSYYAEWKIKALNQWGYFIELNAADDPGGFYHLVDDFYKFLMRHDLRDLQQNSPLMERLIETLLMESTVGNFDPQIKHTVFSAVGLAGHVKFFNFILNKFPASLVLARGYHALNFLCGFGNSRRHIECLAQGLAFGIDLNPDFKTIDGLIGSLLSSSYGRHTDTARLNILKTMLHMLIDAGADLNGPCSNRMDSHPLQIAICGGAHTKLIEEILLRGGSVSHVVSLPTGHGILKLSALDLALGLAKVHPDTAYANRVVKLIKRAGGKLNSGAHTCTVNIFVPQVDLSAYVLNQPSPFREIPQEIEMAHAIYRELANPTYDFTSLLKLVKSNPDFYVETDLVDIALRGGREDLANFILRNLPFSPMRQLLDRKSKRFVSLLFYAVALMRNSTLQLLLEDGANPNDLNIKIDTRFVLTALHVALFKANPDGVKLLVDYGASIDSSVYLSPSNFFPVDYEGTTIFAPHLPYETMPIFQFAAEVGNHELGFMLLEHKQTGKFEVDDACRFRQAVLRGDLATLQKLAPKVDVNSSPQKGKRNTALHLAYLRGWKEGVDYLVNERGADQAKVNADGKIPKDLETNSDQKSIKGISKNLILKLGLAEPVA